MVSSRLRRYEERNASRRIAVAIVGSLAVVIFLGLFGLRLLVGFSLLVDKLRGNSPSQQTQQASILLPPVLDPLPEATNSATISVRGKAAAKVSVILYVNSDEYKTISANDDGSFSESDIPTKDGDIEISAKVTDSKGQTSDLSNVVTTTIDRTAPKLAIDSPEDNIHVNNGTHKVTVSGLTDEDMKVTINGRIVVLKSDGSFSYDMPLNDGENVLSIISRDAAGNETKTERHVTYDP